MSNNKDYLTFFHKLHCILRDGEIGLTGLNALNEINNMVLILFMEQHVDKYELDESNKFSYVYNKYVIPYITEKHQTEKNKKLESIIDKYNGILKELHDNTNTKKYIFSDTNKISAFYSISNKGTDMDVNTYFGAAKQLAELFMASRAFFYGTSNKESKEEMKISKNQIKEVMESIDYDILGDAYEKFKEDEVGNQGKNTGQYFTPRPVVKFVVEDLVKPKHNELCYDSSCGTGGFFHYLNKFVHANSTEKAHAKFKSNMYGNDKTPEIIKPLYINLFLHDIPVDNITNRNSVSQTNCWEQFERFDCIVGNPPYGMSIKSNPEDYVKEINKVKLNYWPKFMQAKKTETVKDSMGQFMIHSVNSLKVGGRFGLVIDRGILNNGTENNSWQKKLRQWLLTVCDFDTIILLPKGIFTHTQFDTAIIYGVKKISYTQSESSLPKPSTGKVKMYEANFVDEKNKKGIQVDLAKPTLELTIKQIVNKDWSLKYDDYVEKVDDSYEGVQYKTLGEVCEFVRGKALTIDKMTGGNYPVIGGGVGLMDNFYSDCNTNENQIIMSNDGSYAGFLNRFNKKLFITSHCNKCVIKDKQINESYLFYFLKTLQNKLIIKEDEGGFQKGQAQPSINIPKMYKEIKIPILPPDHQERIVKFIDEHIGQDYVILDRLVSEFKDIDLFKFLLYEDYDTFEVAIKMAQDLIDYDKLGKKRFNTRRKWCFSMVPSKPMKLGELVNYDFGTRVTNTKDGIKTSYEGNKYNVYGGGGATFQVDKFNREKGTLIMSRFGVSPQCVRIVNETFFLNDSGMSLTFINNKVNKKYIENYLLEHQTQIYKYAEGQGQKNMQTVKLFRELCIQVPSIQDQEKVVKMIDVINKEESDFSQGLRAIGENIKRMYQCVEQLVESADVNTGDSTDQPELSDESDANVESESESESDSEPEPEEIEIKGKTYILEGTKVYVKTKKGTKGEQYGTYTNDKFKKLASPKEIEV
jgi:type I restriction-modification system DNA methylase subunit